MKEIHSEKIKKKLSGKYEHLYPIYKELCDKCFHEKDVRILLKTIYLLVDSDKGLLTAIFWKEDALEVAIPIDEKDERILKAEHLNYKGLNSMVRLKKISDVDEFVENLFNKIYSHIQQIEQT